MNKPIPDPAQWYSLVEATQFTPVNSREILALHIRNGFLKAKAKGKGTARRYLILGEWLNEYIKEYNHKATKYSRFMEFKDVPINYAYEKFHNKSRRK